jgi:hypothetical protein
VTRGAGLLGLVRSGLRLDRSQSDPWVALRNTVGVVAPLVLAVGTDSPTSAGLASTVGALQTAFADRPGPYRLRLLRMLGTALAAGTTSALAVAGSRSDAWSVLLLAALAFVTGLLLAGGPSATQVGVAGVAAALLIGHLPQPAGTPCTWACWSSPAGRCRPSSPSSPGRWAGTGRSGGRSPRSIANWPG